MDGGNERFSLLPGIWSHLHAPILRTGINLCSVVPGIQVRHLVPGSTCSEVGSWVIVKTVEHRWNYLVQTFSELSIIRYVIDVFEGRYKYVAAMTSIVPASTRWNPFRQPDGPKILRPPGFLEENAKTRSKSVICDLARYYLYDTGIAELA